MTLNDPLKQYVHDAAASLRGADRRLLMARTVRLLGVGGQRLAERQLGWNRVTIRKGLRELDAGRPFVDAFAARGRKRSEEHFPTLLEDIRAVVDAQCQTDPTFHSQRLYSRLTAGAVRQQLLAQRGYTGATSPCAETIRRKMHQLGYHLTKVRKCRPKKSPPDGGDLRALARRERGRRRR
jgi:hypothetical protein